MLHEGENIEDDAVEVERSHVGAARPGEIQEVLDDTGRSEGLLLDLLEQSRPRVVGVHLATKHLGVGGDPGERRIHLVSHTRGEQADGGHLLGVQELLLEAHPRGDVVEQQKRSAPGSARLTERCYGDIDHGRLPFAGWQVKLVHMGDSVRVSGRLSISDGVQESLGEDVVEASARHVLAAQRREVLHGPIPPNDPPIEIEHDDARSHALEDVGVVVGERLEIGRLLREARVEPRVGEGTRRVGG